MTDAVLLSDPRFFRHRSNGYHPERPERLEAARAAIERSDLSFAPVEPRPGPVVWSRPSSRNIAGKYPFLRGLGELSPFRLVTHP